MNLLSQPRCTAFRATCRLVLPFIAVASASLAMAEEIVIGQTASFTNPLVASLSREYNAGIELAVERVNVAGACANAGCAW